MTFPCPPLSPRHEDLKMLLDSNKDGQKLEAMRIIIGVSDHNLIPRLSCRGLGMSHESSLTLLTVSIWFFYVCTKANSNHELKNSPCISIVRVWQWNGICQRPCIISTICDISSWKQPAFTVCSLGSRPYPLTRKRVWWPLSASLVVQKHLDCGSTCFLCENTYFL